MSLSDLSAAQLKTLINLVHEKESLQSRIAKIDSKLAQFDGAPETALPVQRRSRRTSRRTGTTLKDSILGVLAQAGPGGLSVKEVAAQAKAKPGSVSVWLYTTGKKVAGLKKVAPGKYTYHKKD